MSLKLWIRAGAALALSLALSSTIALAQDYDHGHDRDDHEHYDHDRHDDHDRWHEDHRERSWEHEHYADHDRDFHEWYRVHYAHLPPGFLHRDHLPPVLEQRLIVNGVLPVEVRTRMQPCPHELEVMLPPPPPNFVHVVIGGNLVLYNRANFQIADVFHFNIN